MAFPKITLSEETRLFPAENNSGYAFVLNRLETGDIVEFRMKEKRKVYCGEISAIRSTGGTWHILLMSADSVHMPEYCRGDYTNYELAISENKNENSSAITFSEMAFIDVIEPSHEYLVYSPKIQPDKIARPVTTAKRVFALQIPKDSPGELVWKKNHKTAKYVPGIYYPDVYAGGGVVTLPDSSGFAPMAQLHFSWFVHRQLYHWRLILSSDIFKSTINPYPEKIFPDTAVRPGLGIMYYFLQYKLFQAGAFFSIHSYFYFSKNETGQQWGMRPAGVISLMLEYDTFFLNRDRHKLGFYLRPEFGQLLQKTNTWTAWGRWTGIALGVKYAY